MAELNSGKTVNCEILCCDFRFREDYKCKTERSVGEFSQRSAEKNSPRPSTYIPPPPLCVFTFINAKKRFNPAGRELALA
jgi:hypothetical protein